MNIEQYIYDLGMMMSDLRVDKKGRIFILVEENSPRVDALYKEIDVPEEYQTLENVEIVRTFIELNKK